MILYQDRSRLSSSSINISTDNCVETVIPKNDDNLLPKCGTLSIGTQIAKKNTKDKVAQYKDITIRNKFTQTVNMIASNTISTQTMHILVLV